jgi:acetolactate synthase-1/2/3 large subunit
MNGADALVRTAIAAGIDVCFANPGTTELPLVAALDRVPGIRPVLCLFEGVCSGAADGYARLAERPALTLLHLGPGLSNASANLHNARRAGSAMVNLIGDHARWHLPHDPLLASDIEGLAQPVCDTVLRCADADSVAASTARAVAAARTAPGHVVALIVPDDVQAETTATQAATVSSIATPKVSNATVERVAKALLEGSAALLLGAQGTRSVGLAAAGRIAGATGAKLFCETFPARVERGGAHPALERLPYFPEQALAALAGVRTLVLAGARSPVAFFGYPGQPSVLVPEGCTEILLASPGEDVGAALQALADSLPRGRERAVEAAAQRNAMPSGALDPVRLGLTLAALQPEGAIVVDEALTSVGPWFGVAQAAPAHTTLALTGGAIGAGLPLATGAAIACPQRPVIAFQADGSGFYTLQALWTQAREGLHVVTLLCANRRYRILQLELARAGIAEPGPAARAFTDLAGPEPDWVALARGLGVAAERVETAESLATALRRGLAERGPYLIEALL